MKWMKGALVFAVGTIVLASPSTFGGKLVQ